MIYRTPTVRHPWPGHHRVRWWLSVPLFRTHESHSDTCRQARLYASSFLTMGVYTLPQVSARSQPWVEARPLGAVCSGSRVSTRHAAGGVSNSNSVQSDVNEQLTVYRRSQYSSV